MTEQVQSWLAGRLPAEWFEGAPAVTVDRDEIMVIGTLEAPDTADAEGDEARAAALEGRIARFREQTREQRIQIAREAERRFERGAAGRAVRRHPDRLFPDRPGPGPNSASRKGPVGTLCLTGAAFARPRSPCLGLFGGPPVAPAPAPGAPPPLPTPLPGLPRLGAPAPGAPPQKVKPPEGW